MAKQIKPIRIHAIDSEDLVRIRHAEIEARLETLGADQVRRLLDHGGLPPEWYQIAYAWLDGDRLEPEARVSPTDVVKVLIAAIALSFMMLFGSPSKAEPLKQATAATDTKCAMIWDPLKLCGALTNKPEEDMQRVVKRIQAVGRDDLNYAILKAKKANTNGSQVRLQCLNAILAAKDAAEGVGIKDASGADVSRPDPAVITSIEDIAELIDAMSPQGPLMTGCAGAAQLFKLNTLQAINGIVTGTLAMGTAGL